jgi:hypothetical protein
MKKIIILIVVFSTAVSLISCRSSKTKPENDTDAELINDTGGINTELLKTVPEMTLEYTSGGETFEVIVKPGTSRWNYIDENGTGYGAEADGPHPLDMLGHMPEIELISDNLIQLNFNFAYPPDERFARYWPEEYLGKTTEYSEVFDKIGLGFNGIILPENDQKGVYEIIATWPEGYGSYTFLIK